MASQNIIRRLLVIRKSFRATAVLAWVFELITLTMELVGDNTRSEKLAAVFLTMDSCFFTFWDVHIKLKDRNLAFGSLGCYFWPKQEHGQPSWAADVVCDICSSLFVICHFALAIVDFVYRSHGSTYVVTLVAFIFASLALIPTKAYDRWFSLTQPQQAEGSEPTVDSQQCENEEAQAGIQVQDPVSTSTLSPTLNTDNLQSEIQSLQNRLTLLSVQTGVFCTMSKWRHEGNHICNRTSCRKVLQDGNELTCPMLNLATLERS